MDLELGISPQLNLVPSVRRKVAWLGARASFERASRDLAELLDVPVSSSEFQRVCHQVGGQFERLGRASDQQWSRPASPRAPGREPELSPKRLVLMADATCVLTVA